MPRLRRNRALIGNYPIAANEVLNPPMAFKVEAANVVSAFARNRPEMSYLSVIFSTIS